MKKQTILIIGAVVGLAIVGIVLVPLLTRRRDTSTPESMGVAAGGLGAGATGAQAGCISVGQNLSRWADANGNWYNQAGEEHIKKTWGGKYASFGLTSQNDVLFHVLGYMKSVDLHPTVTNLKNQAGNIEAYLKGNDKSPHWDVPTVGNLRCA